MAFRGERKKLDLGKYSLVVLESFGKKFEVIVEPRTVLRFYKGEAKPEDAIVLMDVFFDAQKGERASIGDLRKLVLRGAIEEQRERLGRTLTQEEVRELSEQVNKLDEDKLREFAAKYILKKGELKLPKDLRDELLEKKTRQIIAYLQKYAINPATKAPYPSQKIREAIESLFAGQRIGEKKIRILLDPLKDVNEELPAVIEALKAILPIRLEIIVAKIRIPPQYTGVAYGKVEKFGEIRESNWLDDGSWEAIIQVPGGQFLQFHKELTDLTHGNMKLEILKREVIS